jgi:hypothetical protein
MFYFPCASALLSRNVCIGVLPKHQRFFWVSSNNILLHPFVKISLQFPNAAIDLLGNRCLRPIDIVA